MPTINTPIFSDASAADPDVFGEAVHDNEAPSGPSISTLRAVNGALDEANLNFAVRRSMVLPGTVSQAESAYSTRNRDIAKDHFPNTQAADLGGLDRAVTVFARRFRWNHDMSFVGLSWGFSALVDRHWLYDSETGTGYYDVTGTSADLDRNQYFLVNKDKIRLYANATAETAWTANYLTAAALGSKGCRFAIYIDGVLVTDAPMVTVQDGRFSMAQPFPEREPNTHQVFPDRAHWKGAMTVNTTLNAAFLQAGWHEVEVRVIHIREMVRVSTPYIIALPFL